MGNVSLLFAIEFGAPLILGIWLGRRSTMFVENIWRLQVQGVVILFALIWLNEVRWDLYERNIWFPETPMIHSAGLDWMLDNLLSSLNSMKVSGAILIGTFWLARMLLMQRTGKTEV